MRLGGKHLDSGHYDLLGLIVGSEGLIGIVTEVTVRILRRPQTARALLIGFDDVEAAGACVAAIIAAGIIPARHGDDGQAGHPRGRSVRATSAIRSTSRRC